MDSTDNAASPEFARQSSSFVEWFVAAPNARLSSKIQLADLRHQSAGRAVVALEAIDEDEELFAVPRSLVLTTTTSAIPPEVLEPLSETGAWPPLIVTIIYEYLRGQASPWYRYFQVLPTSFQSLMFWTAEELDHLQASAVVQKIGKQSAENSWKETIIPVMMQHPALFPVEGASENSKATELVRLAHMAGSLIMAYAFDIDKDDDGKGSDAGSGEDEYEEDDEDEPLKGMVPFADMLNADADRNNARLFQETEFLIMKATRPIPAGEQIFNDYGPLPRSDLLRMYGYVTPNYAPYDVVEFSYGLLLKIAGKSPEDPKWLEREGQLDDLDLLEDGYAITRPTPEDKLEDVIPGQLHMVLRALCADSQDAKPLKKPKDAVTIEEAALLSAVLTRQLSRYPTSLEEDERASKSLTPNDSTRYAMALEVRKGEKEILHRVMELCHAHIAHKTEEIANDAKSGKRKHDDSPSRSKKVARRN